jgi:hypothetical protein
VSSIPATSRTLAPSQRRYEAGLEVRRLREEATARYGEVDLLVAALQDHIRDLRAERDALRAQLSATTEDARRESATWLWRGSKGPR